MSNQTSTLLTGIKPTGTPHIGNYLGAIHPTIHLANSYENSMVFIADYHALNTVHDGKALHDLSISIASSWLACGLDPDKTILFKQSSVPEVFELSVILNSLTPKGWMNKAHAYKAAVETNRESGRDDDEGVNMGLYTYPVLMAADILLYGTNLVPAGKDQRQHIEIARDIAQRFNKAYNSNTFVLPDALVQEEVEAIPGVDGRKMSKSYDNIIPLFSTPSEWKKIINKIPTDSSRENDPKDVSNSILFDIYKKLADESDVNSVKLQLEQGVIGWGKLKDSLVNLLDDRFREYSEKYNEYINKPDSVEKILLTGSEKARSLARAKLDEVRKLIGSA